MTEQFEALRLADVLTEEGDSWWDERAAAELRRLHELNEDLYRQGVGLIARIAALEQALAQAVEALEKLYGEMNEGHLTSRFWPRVETALATARQTLGGKHD